VKAAVAGCAAVLGALGLYLGWMTAAQDAARPAQAGPASLVLPASWSARAAGGEGEYEAAPARLSSWDPAPVSIALSDNWPSLEALIKPLRASDDEPPSELDLGGGRRAATWRVVERVGVDVGYSSVSRVYAVRDAQGRAAVLSCPLPPGPLLRRRYEALCRRAAESAAFRAP
jgi:hypothetical protein